MLIWILKSHILECWLLPRQHSLFRLFPLISCWGHFPGEISTWFTWHPYMARLNNTGVMVIYQPVVLLDGHVTSYKMPRVSWQPRGRNPTFRANDFESLTSWPLPTSKIVCIRCIYPRHPITFWEWAKYYAEEVIGHPNHHLRYDWIPRDIYIYIL